MSTDNQTKAREPNTEFIVIHETVLQSWARDASTFMLFAGLIGLGVIAESAAMQWAGMLVAIVVFVSRTGPVKMRRMTREQAINHLVNGEGV
ncbi:hypothetical protein NAC44_12085 [Allorhizobium sp. BGMRC 0089]|uniref:hypothetical protein n=1 Tax=Allorhizobium sonneratiae TaxID=2934936 RepID=UPI0020332828|nr:hypothetical protein [Allorhizobium sonneratiae]MCM2293061.1 hypothetical protein [Allorhizobium sonneratiae]